MAMAERIWCPVSSNRILFVVLLSQLWFHLAEAEYRGTFYFNGAKSYEDQQAEEKQRLNAIVREDWFDLVRYLCGLGFCIFCLIGLYFHQFASYYFLKRYTCQTGTIRKMGRVISCESMTISARPLTPSNHSGAATEQREDDTCSDYDCSSLDKENDIPKCGYRIFVVYSASAPIRIGLCTACAPDTTTISHSTVSNESLVETDYFQWFRTNTPRAIGSEVPLILLKDNPKSACTPEVVNSHLMQAFSRKNCGAISLLGLSLLLGVVVLMLASVFEILSMPYPETQRPIGWSILITFSFVFVIAGYVFCKMLFDHFKAKVFLSAVPAPLVRRRLQGLSSSSITGHDPTTIASIHHQQSHTIDVEEQQQHHNLSLHTPP
ncbi:hypothetical protein IV203_010786 [Nitzschia inconspicua]|uniref:Uncharacterized protein n=1 Tax=Nitzschia inconspicua TaxID=303405 RepID=A0A9K3KXH7_9STRA|nr:hypothetical protein IV203_010786 [Nitzschia inconspicua]